MLSIVVQAGGESRRMGQDKALLPLLGKPLVQRVVERLSLLADEVLVTTNHPEAYQFLGLPLFPDVLPGRGALGGLYTALLAAGQPLVVVVACDMPFINASLLAAEQDLLLASDVDLVIPHLAGGLEPFHAIYRRETCLPEVEWALSSGKWRVDAWFHRVRVHKMLPDEIRKYDPDLLSFWNVNTPEDLQLAVQLASRE